MLKVVIIDRDHLFVSEIKGYLSQSRRYEVVGTTGDSEEGLKMIGKWRADIAIIDLFSPNKDGLYVLEELESKAHRPACIMLSSLNNVTVTNLALNKGADYCMVKPVSVEVLVRRMDDVCALRPFSQSSEPEKETTKTPYSPEEYVLNALKELGISRNFSGHSYIRTAFLLAYDDETILSKGVTSILYPRVAETHDSTPARIERGIRHVIGRSWAHSGSEHFNKTIRRYHSDRKPPNAEFISALVDGYYQHLNDIGGSMKS